MSKIARYCNSRRTPIGEFSGSPQEPCTAVLLCDGKIENGCHDPCRFMMGKDGQGVPAKTSRD